MAATLNVEAWHQLLQEDLDWLMDQPRTLERDHVEGLLKSLLMTRPRAFENFIRDETLCEFDRQAKDVNSMPDPKIEQ